MIALMVGALRARRAQTWCVLVLAVLAVAAAVAGPWYVLATTANSAITDANSVPAGQRLVTATRSEPLTANNSAQYAMDTLRDQVRTALPLRNAPVYLGVLTSQRIITPRGPSEAPIATRDGACSHLSIVGRCPSAADEVLISAGLASTLGRAAGQDLPLSTLPVGAPGPAATPVHIVGVYGYGDLTGAYWAGSRFSGLAGGQIADPVFTTAAGVLHIGLADSLVVAEVPLPASAFVDGAALDQTLTAAGDRLNFDQVVLQSHTGAVLDLIANDQHLIQVGVAAALGQLILLCWFAIFLASRYTAADRRADAALVKLRGLRRGWMIRLIAAESAGPILLALVPGALLGYLGARVVARAAVEGGDLRLAVQLSAASVAVAIFGSLTAAVLGESRNLRASVVDLLRRVPPRSSRLRAGVVDLVVVSLAVATAYQVHAAAVAGIPGLSVGLLAQGLIELAVALVAARLLMYLSVGVGGWALRGGRVRLAMGSLQVARRPGTDRMLALVAIATAILASAAMSWDASLLARAQRATVDGGAARVLTVQAANPTQLLYAVRRADPGGRAAMAAVLSPNTVSGVATLAVDSSRLAAVASWPTGYPDQLDMIADRLRLSTPAVPAIHASMAQIDAGTSGPAGQTPTWLVADLRDAATGALSSAWFGPLSSGRASYQAPVGCTGPAGCELIDLRPVQAVGTPAPVSAGSAAVVQPPATEDDDQPLPAGVSVSLYRFAQVTPAAEILSGARLGDIRWFRGSLDPNAAGLSVAAQPDQLTLTGTEVPPGTDLDQRVFILDAPLPVPVLAAGTARPVIGESGVRPFNGGQLPVRRVATVTVLPEIGNNGILVDLETARRSLTDPAGGTQMQVWLAGDAPAGIVDRLRTAGLQITSSSSVAGESFRLDRQGSAAALRFQLFSGVTGVLLAAGTLLVAAAAQRRPRAQELAALRTQGLSGRLVRGIGVADYLGIVLAGLVIGGVASAVAGWLVAGGSPPFPDGWNELPAVGDLRPGALGAAVLAAALVLAAAAVAAAAALVRQVRHQGGRP